jgi:hypothetical protein
MTQTLYVKWAGPNTPVVRLDRNNDRLYLNKRELVDLRDEINHFLKFYHDDFKKPNIDWIDEDDKY